MSAVGALRIIDSLEDIFIDYRGMNTKDVVRQLRQLRLEIADELSSKDSLKEEKKQEQVSTPSPQVELTLSPALEEGNSLVSKVDKAKFDLLKSSTGLPSFISNVQKLFGISNVELAKTLEYAVSSVSLWKSGRSKISRANGSFVCRKLETSYGIPEEISKKFISTI